MVPLAFFLILGLAGLSMIIKKETSFSNNRTLVRPNSIYVGIALMLFGFVNIFFSFSGIYIVIRVIILLLIFIVAFLKSKKNKLIENVQEKKGVRHPILVIIVGLVALYLFLMLIGM